jgi:ankyrin repeat protein
LIAGYDPQSGGLLQSASAKGLSVIVRILLDAGSDVHAGNDLSLRWASDRNHVAAVKVLLEYGADVHACNDSPLELAKHHGCKELVKLLESHGAKILGGAIPMSRLLRDMTQEE